MGESPLPVSKKHWERGVKIVALSIPEILQIIPHRYPFLLIDVVDELEPGVRARGRKNVTFNEPFFQGHFPGEPVMPGVLIVEALAQIGAVAILSQEEFKGRIAYFAGVDKFRFRQPVRPGDCLDLEVEVVKVRGSIGRGKATARVSGQVVAEGELTFAVGPASPGN